MVEAEFKNIEITDIDLDAHIYNITVPVKQSYLDEFDEYYFMLKERDTESVIYVRSSIVKQVGEYIIFNLIISFNEHKQTFLRNNIWDLYINRIKDNELKMKRIKSNYDNIRLQSIVMLDHEKMFYPYTTKKGKISFRINDYFLFSKLETVNFLDEGISFSGYFNYPPLFQTNGYEVVNINLIVTNNINEDEIKLPVKQICKPDFAEKYPGNENLINSGIEGNFDIKNYIFTTEQNIYFKFNLEIILKKDNKIKTIRSTRMRCDHFKDYPIRKILSYDGEKVKVRVKPTKESKYLSIRVSKYNFKNEVIRNTRSKWLEIRRSSKLKKAYKAVFYFLGKLPAKKNIVIFESFLGKQYSDSPRAIYEYMLKHNLGYKMYWSADRRYIDSFKDKNVNHVRRFSIKWLLLMATAGYWVSNSRLPLWIPKPKRTTYLQTWHGTPLKRLAADMDEVRMPGTNTVKYKQNFVKEANKWDYLVSPNAYSTEIFRRAFQFDRTMVESGYPRNDFLINFNNEQTISEIKNRCNLPLDKKILLYAPTWRDNQFYAKGKYKFDLQMDLDRMQEEFGEDYIIILRLHYLVAENLDLTGYEGFVYDFSHHEDIRELYLIADLLITDYSSVFFDYANLRRPMLFYVYDIDDYRDNLRGFYFDFETKAPGPLVKTTEEIIYEIKKIEQNGFIPSEKTEAFYKRFCYLEDGNASERVVKEVFKK
ncbi:CDP-glycerol glycerophosphotransferase family protein [Virgibacillus dakarensis]|uniref:CDP-glycerol:poly(Glycerophosphate) glycerophosphotransferase n=1 Tax=Lentibacillus populi TaxID=1827502 RepID=A0A9W5TUR4_9BACI|nr:CDP-glycerol glycerophosphotransferase family protein [Lentibacillus populi]MTW87102.1 CDP-glycerol glycerophosphotransferase family protein [Virgibacillus dakarensis]GGB32197.1 CDP-glycerol:poly(glycerophosphate) glycerophosphotransferase [Lentibacillus populi]